MSYVIKVDGIPVAQARPRVTKWGTYDPPKSKQYKQLIVACVNEQLPTLKLEKPLKIGIKVYRPIQKSISKKEHTLRANNIHLPAVKPDLDNYIKGILDGLSMANIWTDDNLVCEISAIKRYGEHPRTEIEISEIVD